MSDEIDVIPEITAVTVGGEVLEIGPLKARQIPAFTRAVRPCMAELGGDEVDWVGLIADHGEDVIEALAIATGKTQEWVGDLRGDELLRLAQAVMMVNVDFFVHRLLPVMRETMVAVGSVIGRASSSDSLAPDTASPTS